MIENYNRAVGQYGEKLAADYLLRHHCKIIDKNFRTRFGEIDLIAKFGDEILFCEVKTRTSDKCGLPEFAVDYHKARKLLKVAQFYLQAKQLNNFWRLDTISIEINKEQKSAKISWFKGIGFDFS
ncbi:MAG: YraN family protein [bacterium]